MGSSKILIAKVQTSHRLKMLPSSSKAASDTNTFSNTGFKLNRTPGRWQYKATPKPRISIRKILNESGTALENNLFSTEGNDYGIDTTNATDGSVELQSSGPLHTAKSNIGYEMDQNFQFSEVVNVDVSTPADFKSIYYEISTIKTPYTFQAGLLKKTRFVTVTSTVEKSFLEESTASFAERQPIIENILTSSFDPQYDLVDNGITYLSPVRLENTAGTPFLQSTIETYSTSFTKLKTQVLPFLLGGANETSYTTLIQSYGITTIIEETRTYLKSDRKEFPASRFFKDFSGSLDEAGSEINLELDFGDTDNSENLHDEGKFGLSKQYTKNETNQSDPHPNIYIIEPEKSVSQIFMPSPKVSTVITTTHPIVFLETLWTSHVVKVVNGISTIYRTLSKSIGNVEKTNFRVETTTFYLPDPLSSEMPVKPYLIKPEYQTVTSAFVQKTTVPKTSSKVLKLTFGARTALTTIYSIFEVPTTLTSFVTTSFPLLPSTLAGYLAPQFHQFSFG